MRILRFGPEEHAQMTLEMQSSLMGLRWAYGGLLLLTMMMMML